MPGPPATTPPHRPIVVRIALVLGALVLALPLAATALPLSPSNANYQVEVTLDPEARTLAGVTTLEWRNLQSEPTDELWFHLYWNAWRNDQSTWMRENRLTSRRDRKKDEIRDEEWSFVEVDSIRLLTDQGETVDITSTKHFESPDDGNPEDRTVMVVDLPRPVAAGETIAVRLAWRAKIPRTFARTGFRGDFFFIAQWMPKLGVYEPEGWNCHQFHSGTEFFSDYGAYDVAITLPGRFVVGATGREVERRENADGTVTHRYTQEDVHAFTWTASPDYLVHQARFESQGLPAVDMRLLLQPEHLAQAERHFEATRAALEYYGRWYGAYPYGHITIVDPAFGAGAGGMEYPTLFTAGTRLFNPRGGGSPEGVTVHEAGHQFWFGLVGNNEFEHAWMDEGLDTFSTARVIDEVFGERRFVHRFFTLPETRLRGFLPLKYDDVVFGRDVTGNRLDRFLQTGAVHSDAQSVPTFRYFLPTGGQLSYGRTAQWLATLEKHLGWETLQQILSTYFARYRFGHPRPGDFFAVAEEIAGEDLDWFFDQVHYRTIDFDYSVDSVASVPTSAKGLSNDSAPRVLASDEAQRYRTEVVVRRLGEGWFPVELLLVFEDGREVRHSWDGREKWKLFVEESEAELDYAIVDPDRVLLLDLRYTNNSKRRQPSPKLPAAKWAARWMIWFQDFLATFTSFV